MVLNEAWGRFCCFGSKRTVPVLLQIKRRDAHNVRTLLLGRTQRATYYKYTHNMGKVRLKIIKEQKSLSHTRRVS